MFENITLEMSIKPFKKTDDDYIVVVEFDNVGVRKMKSSFAKLKKI